MIVVAEEDKDMDRGVVAEDKDMDTGGVEEATHRDVAEGTMRGVETKDHPAIMGDSLVLMPTMGVVREKVFKTGI